MKKHIILLGLLATTSLAFAQAGKVGVTRVTQRLL